MMLASMSLRFRPMLARINLLLCYCFRCHAEQTLQGAQPLEFKLQEDEVVEITVSQINADAVIQLYSYDSGESVLLSEHSIPKHRFCEEKLFITSSQCTECKVNVRAFAKIDTASTFSLAFEKRKKSLLPNKRKLEEEVYALLNTASALWFDAESNPEDQQRLLERIQRMLGNAVSLAREANMNKLVHSTMYLQAFVAHLLNDYVEQSKFLHTLLPNIRFENKLLLYATTLDIAAVYVTQNQFDNAMPLLEKVIGEATTSRHLHVVADAYLLQGRLLIKAGKFDDAIVSLKKARPYFEIIGDWRNIILSHLNLGYAYRRATQPKQAKSHLMQAKMLSNINEFTKYEVQADISLATLHRMAGEYQAASFHIAQAARHSDRFPHDVLSGRVNQEKARLANVLGQFELAADYYTLAKKDYQRVNAHSNAITIDYFLGQLLTALKQFEQAKVHVSTVLEYDLNNGSQYDIGTAYHRLANIELALDNVESALKYQEQALSMLETTEDSSVKSGVYSQAADIFAANNQISQAKEYYLQALQIAVNDDNHQMYLNAALPYAQFLSDIGDDASVLTWLNELLSLILTSQSSIPRFDKKRYYLATFQHLTELYTNSAIKTHVTNEEMLRFIDAIRAKSHEVSVKHSLSGMLEQKALARLRQNTVAFANLNNSDDKTALLSQTRLLADEVYANTPFLANDSIKQKRIEALPLENIHASLPDKVTVLYFDTGDTYSHVWALNKHHDIARTTLPSNHRLQQTIQPLFKKFSVIPTRRQNKNAESQRYIARVLDWLSPIKDIITASNHVVIIPDGPFHYLPLSALLDSWIDKEKTKNIAVTFSPSLSVFYQHINETKDELINRHQERSALIISNPLINLADGLIDALTFRATALPFSELESKAVEQTFDGNLTTLSHKEANKENLLSLPLVNYDIVHFATHGVANAYSSALSGLILSNHASPNNILLADEISQLTLNAELVVLSGCETAAGEFIDGEGLVGLSRAFFNAGAKNVVASLWPVQDQASAVLMSKFYSLILDEAMAPEHALQQAKNHVKNYKKRNGHQPWAAPHFWAGFVFQGVGSLAN